nr:hypothetical protein CFP56_26815 [Quercus suber]
MKPRTLSKEEEAELARGNKRVKDSHHVDFNKGPSDGSLSRNNHNHWNKTNVLFRDKLVGKIPGAFAHAFDFTDHMDVDSDSENDEEDTNELHQGLVAIKLSKDTKECIRERWCKAIIVKLVGRSVSFSYMQNKLNQLWKPESRMEVMELSHGFFLVRFFSKEDLNSVLRQGPWFLGDHFLSLRPWELFFKPSSANVSMVDVWIRLYELPIELYEAEILREIENSIGKAVSYEGIQKLYFSCGRLGHLKEACPYTVRKSKDSVATAEAFSNGNTGSRDGKMKPRTLSKEEEAELARGNKRVKDSHHVDFNKGPSDGSLSRNNHNHWNKTNVLFRDKLVGKIPGAFAHAFDFTDHMDVDSDSENDEEDTNELHQGLVAIKLSKDTKECIRERWCKAIIVKLVGRSVSFSYMQNKLNQLWKPESRMEVMELSHGFFLVRFFSKEDLNSVLRQGPWFLGDHFLSLRPWELFFKPSSANVSMVDVWIRLYELPIELYEAEILREIENSIGKAVSYEGIQKLYFSCGRLGHLKEACPYTVRKSKDSVATAEAFSNGNTGSRDGHEECRTDTPSTLLDSSASGTSVVEEVSGQYGP